MQSSRVQPSHQPIQILPQPQNFTYFCLFLAVPDHFEKVILYNANSLYYFPYIESSYNIKTLEYHIFLYYRRLTIWFHSIFPLRNILKKEGTFRRKWVIALLLFLNLKKVSYSSIKIMDCNNEIDKELETDLLSSM